MKSLPRSVRTSPLPLLLLLLLTPVALAAPAPSGVTVSWTPARVVLGQDSEVELKVHVPPGSGPVRGAASSGSFDEERMEGGPVRTFRWTPPAVRHPLVAVFAFWVEGPAAPSDVAILRVPLLGKTRLDVSTAAGASVVVEVGGSRFGPVRADGRGKARVPVEVPPGVRVARVLATRDTLHTDASIPLDPPQEAPLVAALTPLSSSEGGWLLVAGETDVRAKELELSVDGAKLTPEGGGGSPLRYRVAPAPAATTVTVTVRRKGGEDRARAVAEVRAEPAYDVAAPVSLAPGVIRTWRPSLFLLAGGSFAGGANTGPGGAVGGSIITPWWERLALELEAGVRSASFDGKVEGLGAVRSHVLAMPVLASVRVGFFQRHALSLYGRAGGGLLPFRHQLSSDFQEGLKESKLSGMGFLSLQGAYRFGRLSALAEVRGAWAPARTPWLDAQLGGLAAFLGMRFEP
ncbi:hypothetical protein [Pyxidicoccus xibeiensis]|uniref:hypothetical protein n=1 Tax=Pyxidicoccus xibeiensis TaxID=2906759 RepID=UPI0020A7D104|nr:hypothetical protein [Pyxidicoccus xibeiensis]MCP3142171.1 hypothetical protein [Pyxidicoccus xibeiensis]